MKKTKQKSATDILRDISHEVFDMDHVPSAAEARFLLEEEGIDMTKMHEWTLNKISGIRARQSLIKAKNKRLRLLEILEECKNSLIQKGGITRETVLAKLNSLGDMSPEKAQAFCHRFESASEEDLVDIEAEIMMLDLHSGEFDDDSEEA